MKKVLIIQTAFIGDVVLATTLLESLHAMDPSIELDMLVRRGNESLLTGHPYLSELLVWDKKSGKYSSLFKLLGIIRKKKYDTVINLQRFAATGMLSAFSGAKEIIGYDKNPFSFLFTRTVKHSIGKKEAWVHEIVRCHQLIGHYTNEPARPPRLYPRAVDYERIKPFIGQPYFVLAPGSVWFTKQYPLHKWVSALEQLPAGVKLYIIGAPEDREKGEQIKAALPGKNIEILAGQLNFLESVALMESAQLNMVNDSAPLHFASARNAPTLAVYCSTVPYFGFGPLSEENYVIETRQPLSCRPCGLHGKKACPEGHFDCALTIQDAELRQIIDNKLKRCIPDQV
ncbi:glycosyltransferase family 9 protein [Flavihumibacter sp. CACIAM 22H1]|uniref:glycosyltransferase family 9 protein n=1 Tax=Flavihumibacter sp. CACIAM 22H1 TaxID=1812911 RepID=UPI0007A7D262|nr:glycosyltransferase family 9 protein [Flavihumibacter sp. CACIAM 22H1]KYP14910.1 MAG: heptosyltransferase [Flavihumibacter sp. CACIAM 22H1]